MKKENIGRYVDRSVDRPTDRRTTFERQPQDGGAVVAHALSCRKNKNRGTDQWYIK
jgi:hypothetical protein